MKKAILFTIILILASLVLVGGGCGEEEEKIDISECDEPYFQALDEIGDWEVEELLKLDELFEVEKMICRGNYGSAVDECVKKAVKKRDQAEAEIIAEGERKRDAAGDELQECIKRLTESI